MWFVLFFFRHDKWESIRKTSPDQIEDPHLKTAQKWVPLLDVRWLLHAVCRAYQVSKNQQIGRAHV